MTLHRIVTALGGELYQCGRRANVPAPGHSDKDRSISLLLEGDRVVIHGFGAVDWRAARDDLRRRGLIHPDGRLSAVYASAPTRPKPDNRMRTEIARRLWEESGPIGAISPGARHLRRRAIGDGARVRLRCHGRAPVCVYGGCAHRRAALVARIDDPLGELTAVELTYLDAAGRPAPGLAIGRKIVGLVPSGSAVRLARPGPALVVGEGVFTTLSAMARFDLPGWALLSITNLIRWTPPPSVEDVVIAADRGRAGETAAARLRQRLEGLGHRVRVCPPPHPFEDWNAQAMAGWEAKEGF